MNTAAFRTSLIALLLLAATPPAVVAAGHESPASTMSQLHWRSIGPYIGGRVVAVSGVPGQRNVFYMGAVDGGVWKSTDYGVKWTNLTDGKLPGSSDSIGALAVAPSDPKVIYAGTGESDIRGDMISGDGVFRSDDGGKSWHHAGLADTHTTMDLLVDPHDANIVYAASMGHVFKPGAHRGVFKSTDGGKHWKRVLFVNRHTGAVDLAMAPSAPKVIYATTWQAYRTPWKLSSGGPGSGLWKSTDGGAHWTNITAHLGLPAGPVGKIGVSVADSNPKVVYAIVQAKGGGLFRSDDGGAHFHRVNHDAPLRQRAFYYMAVFADPKDPDTVYVPNVDALWVSHDGGKSFRQLHTPHGDNHALWIDPDDTSVLLEGNDGGATVSTDGGTTWSTEHNQPTGQFYHVNLDHRFPFHIYGAQQDEGSFEAASATPQGVIPLSAWHAVAYGESTVVVPQPDKPTTTYGAGYYSIFLSYNRLTGQFRSVSPWPDYHESAPSSALKNRFGWIHPILFSPAAPKQLLIGSQYVLESDDHGHTWKRISPDLTRNDPSTEGPSGGPVDIDHSGAEIYPSLSAIAVSPRDAKTIWAGSADGLVHLTTDGGRHWHMARPAALPKWSRIDAIEPSHTRAGTAYLTARRYMWDDFHPYVFKTTDGGRHWQAITHGLPDDQYAMDIVQDPDDPDLLFLATDATVYASFDGGDHWKPLGTGLPRVQVRGLAIDTRQGMLVAATHGRAFWVLDNLSMLEQMTHRDAVADDAASVFAPQDAWLSHAYGQSPHADRIPAAGSNPKFGATVFFHIPAGYDGHTKATLTFTDAQGHVVRRLTLHPRRKADAKQPKTTVYQPRERTLRARARATAIHPGMNHVQWNLRYADATEVDGMEAPAAAGGLDDDVTGPRVVPGTYRVTLAYGDQHSEASFQVRLDPRLQASQADLQARLALQLKIHHTLDHLDRQLNRALALRKRLRTSAHGSSPALRKLDAAIDHLVQLQVHSSEEDLAHMPRLRSRLAYLAANVGLAYARPQPAQYRVYRHLDTLVSAGEKRLGDAEREARTQH